MSEKMKGNQNSKGNKITEEQKKKMSEGQKRCGQWKGEFASYYAKHNWTRRWLGKPERCSDCGISGVKKGGRWNIDWANKDHKYRRVKEDWVALCHKCHGEHDKTLGLRKH